MAVAVERRRFDVQKDARLHVCLTDGESLYEVVAVRGMPAREGGRPDEHAALRLLDVSLPLPADRFEELETAPWVPLAEVEPLDVVEQTGHHSG